MHFSQKTVIWCITALGVSACQPTIAPVEQVDSVQKINQNQAVSSKKTDKVSVERKQLVSQYHCQNDITIKISRTKIKNGSTKASNLKAIRLNFRGTEHRLSPAVAKNGKKFSNIRWTWQEFLDGSAELKDNGGKILARECRLE